MASRGSEPSLAAEQAAPWYRRQLTPLQHAALLIAALALGAVVCLLVYMHQRHAGAGWWSRLLSTPLLPCVASWPLFGHPSRWAPPLGLGVVAAAALSSIWTTPVPLIIVIVLTCIALMARPRPNRSVIRWCAISMSVLGAVVGLLASN